MKNFKEYTVVEKYTYSTHFGWESDKEFIVVLENGEVMASEESVNITSTNSHEGSSITYYKVVATSPEDALAYVKAFEEVCVASKFLNYASTKKTLDKEYKRLISVAAYRFPGTKELNRKGLNKYSSFRDKLVINALAEKFKQNQNTNQKS